jgi:DNA-binding NarL/FixJ family response regulator
MLGPAPRAASLELEALALVARGLVASLDADPRGVESFFLEAAELLESAQGRLLLPDTPHAMGATVALVLCEPGTAEHLLTRALARDVGGRALRLRHRLLLGWVALRSGRWSAAQAALEEARSQQLAPRERLLRDAIDAGLARRAGDLARLAEAWRRAEGMLLRHSPDLLALDAVGELTITASRLGHWDRVSAKARDLGDVLRALGQPPMWLLPLRWAGLQAALASDDHEAVSRRAAEIEAIAPVHRRLGALGEAARAWVAVLNGRVEPSDVAAASGGLKALGLTWEASRLTGQAAIRSSNPSVTRALLEQARDLRSTLPTADSGQEPSAASVLSEREQVVAQFVVDGLTYKEIGAQLYISPKTVEHHVAKIRQKLGTTTRAEMLASLRTL